MTNTKETVLQTANHFHSSHTKLWTNWQHFQLDNVKKKLEIQYEIKIAIWPRWNELFKVNTIVLLKPKP